ncbi:MAG: ZIP family metal transporter [Candidatus Micrarchaeota archaeon]|nr:ZIP family metal transporter [Candidatus Micrarchaeota archaeon]
MVLEQILLATIIVSVISLVGVFLAPTNKKDDLWLVLIISFAAGAMLAGAFFDVLPEALDTLPADQVLTTTLLSILMFFILEKFVYWHHNHHHIHDQHKKGEVKIKAVGYLNLIGDGMHNFFDGVAIAASFMTDFHLGVITTIAIVAHEIPQEIGDFGLLIYSGFSRSKALFFNLLSALISIIGAVVFFYFAQTIKDLQALGLAFTAGTFIYMSCTDLIPELFHNHEKKDATLKKDLLQTIALFIGVIVIYIVVKILK